MHGRVTPEDYLAQAKNALAAGSDDREMLDQLPFPLYTTDAQGFVNYCNPAGAEFVGRPPRRGEDRWCIGARLFGGAGEPMAHEQCSLAEALRTRQAIRDQVAIAERPDGSCVAFRSYSDPVIDDRDALVGGVALLVDVTEEQKALLSDQASRCRRLASATYERATASSLKALAAGFEETVRRLRSAS